jgi:oligopeptide transport system substrate-binding protein
MSCIPRGRRPAHRLSTHRVPPGIQFLLAGSFLTACGPAPLDKLAPGEMVLHAAVDRIRGFDPARANDVGTIRAVSKIYEGLLQYNYLERPYRVEPALAAAMPEISDDKLTYRFRIRDGIYFQDDPCFTATHGTGREVTAQDVVYSIQRIADAGARSTGYWVFNDRIIGLDAWRETTLDPAIPPDYDRAIPGLKAPDRTTVEIRLKRPFPQLLWVLTMPYGFVVAREAVEHYGDQFINHPVGTGPFVLERWEKNYRLEYVRSPKWAETGRVERYPVRGAPGDQEAGLLADAGQPLPIIDRVVNHVVGDPSTQWLMFLTGFFGTSYVTKDNWNAVFTADLGLTETFQALDIELSYAPTMVIRYIGFNMDDPVVGTNQKLRQAMATAFDTDTWLAFHNHRDIRPNGPIPPGVAGYTDRPIPHAYDLERAEALMAEAGYPEGVDPETGRRLTLQLDIGNAGVPEVRRATELFISFMERIGIRVEPRYNNRPAFFDRLDRRQVQFFALTWFADYPDADNFLQLFYGPNASPGSNRANYVNPGFDALYEEARTLQDSPERSALFQRMADIVVEDSPWIFLGVPLAHTLKHRWVHNFKHHDFPYGVEKYWRIVKEDGT